MQRENERAVTLFIDIDGTILKHQKDATGAFTHEYGSALPGVVEKFNRWSGKGYCIILTTARRESMREATEKQLRSVGLFWDHLIMGIGMGRRIVINDMKVINGINYPTAVGINLVRDEGFENIEKYYNVEMKHHLGEECELEI
jgi:hypothetical protein